MKGIQCRRLEQLPSTAMVDMSGLTTSEIQCAAQYDRIVVVVNIFRAEARHQHFGMIENAFIRIVDARNNQELCRFNLSEHYDGMTAMIFGEVYRHGNEWKFNAIGQATTDPSLQALSKRYQ